MAAGLTNYGVSRINALAGEEGGLDIDRMVFALIEGIDHTYPIDKAQGMPTAGQTKYTATIPEDYKGYVTEDQVVYSVILGSDLGNWSFNVVCLVEAETDEVVAVLTLPETAKYKTDLQSNTVGNMLTRNFVLSYQDVKSLTGITFDAETWQFDYVAEMNTHGALVVDPTTTGADKKHVTDTQAKKWEDHVGDDDLHLDVYPIGAPIPWFTDTAPTGYAIMAGQSFNKTTYPKLALVYTNGIIPDMRGYTLTAKTASETVNTTHTGENKSHTHNITIDSADIGTKYTSPNNAIHDHGYGVGGTAGYGQQILSASDWYENRVVFEGGGSTHQHTVTVGVHAHSANIGGSGGVKNTVDRRLCNYIVRLA